MRKLFALILAVAMCLSLAACGASDSADTPQTDGGFEKQSIKISYSTGDQGMDGIAANRLKELVAEKTDGAVTIECYGNAQLAGGDMNVCSSFSFRAVDMTCAFSVRRLWRA